MIAAPAMYGCLMATVPTTRAAVPLNRTAVPAACAAEARSPGATNGEIVR